jgi:hypothetical protein
VLAVRRYDRRGTSDGGIPGPIHQAGIQQVTGADLIDIDEAVTWGIRRRAASAVVTETVGRVLSAIREVPGDDRVLTVIRKQAERIALG